MSSLTPLFSPLPLLSPSPLPPLLSPPFSLIPPLPPPLLLLPSALPFCPSPSGGGRNNETAEAFFKRVQETTGTLVLWPSRLKIGAKSKKGQISHIISA